MARAATTTDAFNAVAEPRRREILDALAQQERSVGELVELLHVAQPVVSKHLRVLREVGLVEVRDDGRRRLYRTDARPLQEIHEWAGRFERLWEERFALIDELLDEMDESPDDRPDARGERP
ncbi:ArsR/SmtB family transcription factor [Isoptericola cucumis]|uniref:Transcriptional regulator, ArsR family protein n=1 Tax=Isoptericola cucumis TaxID=1776856 RepID=A0ABQ2B4Z6_9MICO|nr:metalloregulator ArsR/SmtB family transcription factor [Isoptericola cucumis]GGI06381.1 putative transcriptional regulator, ArsR family protein [Isoptericola cucumis]